jgi:outer membrane lipopolysaccharide assembly protein LptE/RlpB
VDTAGKVLEYETQQTIRFSVVTHENLLLVEEQEVSMAKDYIFSSSNVLSTEREDKTLRKTLQRNLVNLAMLHIAAAAR